MARKKVKLAFIENVTLRRITYNKRVKSLVKKAEELSVLCGVDVCAVVYGPYDRVPDICPSSQAEVRRIISAFKRRPEEDQSGRHLNQEMYVKQNLSKAQEALMKRQRSNREMEMGNLVSDIFSGKLTLRQVQPNDFEDLVCVIDDKLSCIQHKMNNINAPHVAANQSINDGGNQSVTNSNDQNVNVDMGQPPSWQTLHIGTSQNHSG